MTMLLKKLQDEVYIYTIDTFEITYMNDLALKRCGWTQDEAHTKTIIDTNEHFNVEIFKEHVAPLLRGEEESARIMTKYNDDYVEITTRIHSQPDNQPVFVSVLRDVTERKLQEKRRLQIVSSVSHELRTPLTSIKGSVRLLKSGVAGNLAPEAMQLAEIADRNTDRMLGILNDILDFEKIVAGKMDLNMEPLELSGFLEEAISVNSGYAVEHGVRFILGEVVENAVVNGDKNRLMQVMSNLMSNAAKYSPPDGEIELSVSDQGDAWRVSVADHGPGIPPEGREKVFESFGQVAPADGKPRKGTGLGLAITRKIIKIHSGEIDFDSTVGEGTTFFFDLPKAQIGNEPKGDNVAIAAE